MSGELRKYGSTSVVQTWNVGFTSEVSDYLVVHTVPGECQRRNFTSRGKGGGGGGSPTVLDRTVIVLDRTVIVLDRTVIVLDQTVMTIYCGHSFPLS